MSLAKVLCWLASDDLYVVANRMLGVCLSYTEPYPLNLLNLAYRPACLKKFSSKKEHNTALSGLNDKLR